MQEEQTNAAVSAENPAETPTAKRRENFFSARRIAKLAIFAALAFVVTFLEFPVFPAASFLKLDFANVFIMLAGFMYGPVSAMLVSAVKELLCLLKSSTGGVGEIANFLMTFSFIIIPATVYRYKKGLKWVIVCLAAATVLQTAAALLVNRFINFPLFMGEGAAEMFSSLWGYIIAFNLIKGTAVSLITVLLYKRISRLLNKF